MVSEGIGFMLFGSSATFDRSPSSIEANKASLALVEVHALLHKAEAISVLQTAVTNSKKMGFYPLETAGLLTIFCSSWAS